MIGKSVSSVLAGIVLVCGVAAASLHGEETAAGTQKPWYEESFAKLTNATGEEVPVSQLKDKIVGVYFSASWCPPCRGFTPQLVKFYNQGAGKENFEIVFVSSDKTADDMKNYMKKDSMPWKAIPFGDASAGVLKRKLGIRGIPTLVIYGSDGKIISRNARWDVVMLGPKALEAWKSPNYKAKTYQDYRKSIAGKKTRKSAKSSSKGKSKKSKSKSKDKEKDNGRNEE